MKIRVHENGLPFYKLDEGDVFILGTAVCMKVMKCDCGNAINLRSGSHLLVTDEHMIDNKDAAELLVDGDGS